jgi:hypothetical protein
MATYQVQGPDGSTYRIDGPDNADPSDVIAQVTGHKQAHSFDALPGGAVAPTGSAAAKAAQSPLSQSDTQNFLAGAGKATMDLGRGAGQWLGLESRQDVADSRKLDAPLMSTKAGKAGDITGTAVDLLPLARIPGAGTLAGAAGIGAGTGLLMPSTSTGETAANAGLGAVASPLGVLAGRGMGALYQGAKAAIAPFLKGGSQDIAGRTLQSFAGGPQAASQAASELSATPATLPGVKPSLGELTSNGGLAQLERSVRNNPETTAAMTARDQSNRAAMTDALDQLAGTPAQRATNVGLRADFSKPYYEQAGQTTVPADAQLGKILARPSMQKAWARASELAQEQGVSLREPSANDIDGQTLQYLRMGLSDLADAGPAQGMGKFEANAVKGTLSDLNGWIGQKVPALQQADRMFAWGSRPINQADIAGQLRDKLVPALGDFGSVPRLNANSYANALRNGDDLAANVSGRSNATLEGSLNPQQMTTLRQIGEQLARRANAADLGRAAGSNTAQNLAGQNLLRQFLGPLGLPESTLGRATQGVLGQSLMRPYGVVAKAAEPDILQQLSRASLDPQYAAQLLSRAPNSRAAQLLWQRQGLLGPLANTAAGGLLGSGNAAQ